MRKRSIDKFTDLMMETFINVVGIGVFGFVFFGSIWLFAMLGCVFMGEESDKAYALGFGAWFLLVLFGGCLAMAIDDEAKLKAKARRKGKRRGR
jgi:hypothetical protein